MSATPIEEIPKIREALRSSFRRGVTRPISWRINQLHQLARMLQENADAFADALAADLGKPRTEVFMCEVGAVIEKALICAKNLEEWTKPTAVEVPDWQKTWSPTVHRAAKGTVLIIAYVCRCLLSFAFGLNESDSPWNYPLILSLQPLYGAISAGCCAVIKISELVPHYAELIHRLFPQYLDQNAYRIVLGEIPEATKLLELQWDHIFYTGNGRVARIISAAAAKHLTPMTLELGGKSPVVIDGTFDMALAAKRLLWGKTNNAGQRLSILMFSEICVCPDFVLVLREKQEELIEGLKAAYKSFYPDGALNNKCIARIISDGHLKRLKGLLERTKGEIVFGGQVDEKTRAFEPTVVKNVTETDSLLEEELFGPILPLVPVDSIEDAIEIVNSRDHALVLYAFTESEETKRALLERTMSGNLVFNDVFQQLSVNELPFGGVGESGYGRQHLQYSFENFVYDRSCLDIPRSAEPMLELRYPPYTSDKEAFFVTPAFQAKIPGVHTNGNGHAH
ncbi:hypothetical protein H0H92_006624 [Tricholoma furcatifolium]|nr:hypothetical protein H0H92_006624 [Tricholoma furcatifolium]